MDEDMVHMYNGILFSHKEKNEFESVIVTWMNPKSLLCRVKKSEREKQIQCIKTYVRNLKNGIDEPICREGMEIQM